MSKEIVDEIDFPDDIISFMKIKFPKAYTDQEKSALKQMESLAEEKKELKELLSKKRDQEKIKIMPINVAACEEAKEKAIKLVQEGALQLSSRSKVLDADDDDANPLSMETQQLKKSKGRSNKDNSNPIVNKPKPSNAQKISFVSAGYAFKDSQMDENEESAENVTKRQLSTPISLESGPTKRLRHISHSSSSDSEEVGHKSKDNPRASEHLRIVGHNISIDFVRRIVEPYGDIIFIGMENRTDGMSPNVLVSMESVEAATAVRNALDNKFIEARLVTVFYKGDGSGFQSRRQHRRRRSRGDNFRSRGRFPFHRNSSFPSANNDQVLPSHFYAPNVDTDESESKRKPAWSGHDDVEHSEPVSKVIVDRELSPKEEVDRGLVVYDDFPKDFEDNDDDMAGTTM